MAGRGTAAFRFWGDMTPFCLVGELRSIRSIVGAGLGKTRVEGRLKKM